LGTLIKEAWDEHIPDTDAKNKNRHAAGNQWSFALWLEAPEFFEYYPGYPSKMTVQMMQAKNAYTYYTLGGDKGVQGFLGKTEEQIKENNYDI